MADVRIEMKGDSEVRLHLSKAAQQIKNLKPAMDDISKLLTSYFGGEAFASRGRVFGAPWRPLSPEYAAYKARRFPGRPPLVKSGDMMKGFKSQTSMTSARIYNAAKHFQYHQQGTRKLPARVMMGINRKVETTVSEIITEHIDRELRKAI